METIINDIKQINLSDDDILKECYYVSAKPVINDIQEDSASANAYASASACASANACASAIPTGDAIKNADIPSEPVEPKEQCYICIDDLDEKHIKLKNCNHSFCYDCLSNWCSHLFKNKLKGSYNNYENNKFTKTKIKLECPTCKVQSFIYRKMERNIKCPVVKSSSLKNNMKKTATSCAEKQ